MLLFFFLNGFSCLLKYLLNKLGLTHDQVNGNILEIHIDLNEKLLYYNVLWRFEFRTDFCCWRKRNMAHFWCFQPSCWTVPRHFFTINQMCFLSLLQMWVERWSTSWNGPPLHPPSLARDQEARRLTVGRHRPPRERRKCLHMIATQTATWCLEHSTSLWTSWTPSRYR